MKSHEFVSYRKFFKKSQSDLANLLGTSPRSVQAYEQGWRKIPPNVEKMVLYLLFQKLNPQKTSDSCWDIRECPDKWKEKCETYQFQGEGPCWFINGTFCEGKKRESWIEKMESCKNCTIFVRVMERKD